MRTLIAFAMVLLSGCGSPGATRSSPSRAPIAETQVSPPSGAVPRCGAPEENVAELSDYGELHPGEALHRVQVRFDPSAHEWMPAQRIDMPMHHATRLAWTNLSDFRPLEGAQGEALRFTFRVLSRNVEHRPEENVFLVEHRARVELVCSESAPIARAEGTLVADIGLDTSACPGLTAQVVEAASALATCTRDAECTVISFGACDIEGLGCYFLPANRDRSPSDVTAALYRLQSHPCPSADCDCPVPPSVARCLRGACVAREP